MTLSLLPSVNSVLPATGNSLVANGGKSELADMIDQLPEASIRISLLAPGIQLRADGVDTAHVRVLADAADSVRLPAILIQRSNFRVIDGEHRVEVAKLRGETAIRARIVDCTDAEALVIAIKSNTLHGLPLSRADRISGARQVLAAHPDWSDRAVAGVTGLSAKSVASLRNSVDDARFSGKRLGADGKRHPVMPAEGRRRAAEYITANPEASLRQIARETDVSLGTAHVVKEKMRRGGDSVSGASGRQASPRGRASARVGEETAVVAVTPIRSSAVASNRGGRPRRWRAISAKLASDPSLRYTEGGRNFLRWMTGHCLQEDEWAEFVDAIPQRWLPEIIQIAVSMSEAWSQFAEKLEAMLDEASA